MHNCPENIFLQTNDRNQIVNKLPVIGIMKGKNLSIPDVTDEEGSDCLYTVAADIIDAHNTFVQGIFSSVQALQHPHLACLLPDELANIYPSEVNDSNCIVGKLRR